MDVAQCDAPAAQRTTLADSIGVRADACGHGKLGGLLSGKLGDNRFLVRSVPSPCSPCSSSPDAPRAGHVAVSPAHPALGRPPLPERAWLLPGGAGSTQAASNQPTDGRHDCMCARRYLMRRTGAAFVMTRSASAGSSQDRCALGSARHQ